MEAITDQTNDNLDNDEESDPDTNFEVRSRKLNLSIEKVNISAFNSAGQSSSDTDCGKSIYETSKTKIATDDVLLENSPVEVSTALVNDCDGDRVKHEKEGSD